MYNIDDFINKVVKKANETSKLDVGKFWRAVGNNQQVLLALRLELNKIGVDETVVTRCDVDKLIAEDITGVKLSDVTKVIEFVNKSFTKVIKETLGGLVPPSPPSLSTIYTKKVTVKSKNYFIKPADETKFNAGQEVDAWDGTSSTTTKIKKEITPPPANKKIKVTFKGGEDALVDGQASKEVTVTGTSPAGPVGLKGLAWPTVTIKTEKAATKERDGLKWTATGGITGVKEQAEINSSTSASDIVLTVVTKAK